jgi:hypothetical protein
MSGLGKSKGPGKSPRPKDRRSSAVELVSGFGSGPPLTRVASDGVAAGFEVPKPTETPSFKGDDST